MPRRNLLWIVGVTLVSLICLQAARSAPDDEYYEFFQVFVETMDQIERNYDGEIDRHDLLEGALRGMVGELDPYSAYISAEELQQFNDTIEQSFGGIGIQIAIDQGQLTVMSPLVDSPAYRAGILSGDRIVAIEGEPTHDLLRDRTIQEALQEAVRRLKGEPGTEVTISVIHPGETQAVNVTLQREEIRVPTVLGDLRNDDDTWDFMLDDEHRIGYVRITAFSRETATELRRALESLQEQGMRGLLLDLRFNPGGLLTSATDICDMFLEQGVIVRTRGRNAPERVWEARPGNDFTGFPVVLLVNGHSASASEIVAACLQDHAIAVVVGERSWGKGSVQNVIQLSEGALKLTTASYWRPSGHNIHRGEGVGEEEEWGVMPDEGLLLDLSDEENAMLQRWRQRRDIVPNRRTAVSTDPAPEAPAQEQGEEAPDGSHAEAGDLEAADEPTETPALEPESEGSDEASQPEEPETEDAAEAGSLPQIDPDFRDRQLEMALAYLRERLAESELAEGD